MQPKHIVMIVGGIIIFCLVLALNPFVIVNAGERGIVLNWGAVSDTVLSEGIHWRTPVAQRVVKLDVRTQKEEVAAESASSDLQNVKTTIALNYNPSADKVNLLYARIGLDYKNRIIDPAIQEAVKSATAKYTAEQLVTRRAEVRDEIKTTLTLRLVNEFIQVSEVSIVNFDFSPSFNQVIEAKVTAEQNALAAKNKLEQVKFEAAQTIATAQAQAEAIKIQAQAINSQGGADYVMLQIAARWDGRLPTTMVPNGALPFLNLNK